MFEACEFYYYFGVLGYVVMIVKFATTKKMKSFYDTIKYNIPATRVIASQYQLISQAGLVSDSYRRYGSV